ncbi:hypothetical protein E6P97_00965 [Patescibacteria group bacterium]|nr:MAG: hypothetical protein E6P97_00965 [Patescibacteria group bacterium]
MAFETSPELFEFLLLPRTEQLCTLAVLHSEVVSAQPANDTNLVPRAQALATIAPRRNFLSRVRGSDSLETIAEAADASFAPGMTKDGFEHPVVTARSQAVASALFGHLSGNCEQCSREPKCQTRGILADNARRQAFGS